MGSVKAVHGFLQQTWPSVPFTPISAGGNLCALRSITSFGTGTFVRALAAPRPARREKVTFAERATVSTRMVVAATNPAARTLPTRLRRRGRGSVVEGSSEGTEL